MTVKRRTIWMSDPQWEELRNRAQNVNESPSRYLAALVEAASRAYIPSRDDIAAAIEKVAVVGGPITREDVDDLYGGVAPPGREVLEPFPRDTAEVAAEVHRDLGLGPDVRVEFDTRPVVARSATQTLTEPSIDRAMRAFRPVPKPGRK